MENRLIITDYRIKLNPQSICLTECTQWLGDDLGKKRLKQNANLIDNSTKGILSPKNIKRCQNAIRWLVVASQEKKYYSFKEKKHIKFKVNFITLTIPPQKNGLVTEKQIKVVLNTWLTYHRKYSKLNNYVWKIEPHKDKRLHIHITTDTFIYYPKIANSWNLILKRNGMLEFHYEKFKNYTPPGTQVKPVEKIKKLAKYMGKYFSKPNEAMLNYRGKVWGCSMKINKVLNNSVYVCPSIIGKVTKPIFSCGAKLLEVFTKPNIFGQKWKVADIYLMDLSNWIKLKSGFLYDMFKELILFLRRETPRDTQLQFELGYE